MAPGKPGSITSGTEEQRGYHLLVQTPAATKTAIRADLVVDVQSRRMAKDEILLLCSDGLTTMIGDEDIARIFDGARGDIARAATALVTEANERGGEDNITVVLVKFEE